MEVLVEGNSYKTIFKIGDRIEAINYGGILIITGVDEFLTRILKTLHWEVSDESYLEGQIKVDNGEPVADNEIKFTQTK